MSKLFTQIAEEFPRVQALEKAPKKKRDNYIKTHDGFWYKKLDYQRMQNRLALLKRNPAACKRNRAHLSKEDERMLINLLKRGATKSDIL